MQGVCAKRINETDHSNIDDLYINGKLSLVEKVKNFEIFEKLRNFLNFFKPLYFITIIVMTKLLLP